MRFIDLFAGIGGFRKGMELAGHECAGFCESVNSDNQSYRQAGNGVTVPAVWEIGERIGKYG